MREYRARTDDRPESWWEHPDQDGLWDFDRSLVEEELEVHRAIGATNPRLEWRDVPDAQSSAGSGSTTVVGGVNTATGIEWAGPTE